MRRAILQRLNLNFWPFTLVPSGADTPGPSGFSTLEKDLITQQLRAGKKIAREFARGRGYSIHPLLAEKDAKPELT